MSTSLSAYGQLYQEGIKKGEPFDSPFICCYESSPFIAQSISSSVEAI